MPPIINAQGISKRFGALPLFQDISFTVSEGDRIGLIGPNGSGKSTLMRILAGEMEPDSGVVATRKRTRLAYVEQQSEFPPEATVRSVIARSLERACFDFVRAASTDSFLLRSSHLPHDCMETGSASRTLQIA